MNERHVQEIIEARKKEEGLGLLPIIACILVLVALAKGAYF